MTVRKYCVPVQTRFALSFELKTFDLQTELNFIF